MRVSRISILKTLLLTLLGLTLTLSQPVLATEYSSTNFKVRDPDLNIGGSQGATSGSFSGSGTTGQEVIGQSNSSGYVVKAGFQYFDETVPTLTGFCNSGNTLRVCDGTTYGADTDTTTSPDTLSAHWSVNGTANPWSDSESGIYSFDYSIKRDDGQFWSGSGWGVTQVRTNTRSLTVTVSGIQLQAGRSYKFVVRPVNGAGLTTTEQESNGVTVQSALTLTIAGVASGQTIKGSIQTNVATTSGLSLDFGTLTFNQSAIAAHDLTVSTNSTNGYFVRVRVDRQLTCDACSGTPTIAAFAGTNDSPAAWGSSTGFGYTTNNRRSTSALSIDPVGRFTAADTWSGFVTTAASTNASEVAYFGGPETGTTRIGYQVRVASSQASGTYTNTIIYLTTATY